MRCLILLMVSVFLCVNSYSQNTTSLPKNTPAYLVLDGKAINIDTLMVRECRAKEIASLIKQMNKVCDENKRIFPWNDVVASINEQEFAPIIINHKCDKCKKNTVVVYFVSPAWTWEKLCGRAGYLVICPHCIEQLDFSCTVMN